MTKTLLLLLIIGVAVSAQAQTRSLTGQKRSMVPAPSVPHRVRQADRTLIRQVPGNRKADDDRPVEPANFLHLPHVTHPRESELRSPDATAQTFVVTTTADTGDGSLRKAIHDANLHPGLDYINFAIGGGVQTIQPKTYYEVIVSPVVIDGTTQPGYAGQPLIELDGSLLRKDQPYDIGLEIDVQGTTVRGLAINRFVIGIVIDTSGGDIIEGNYIGTDPTGGQPLPDSLVGVGLYGPNNRLGGTTLSSRNVISSCWHNVEIIGNQAFGNDVGSGNLVQGNIIGLDASGTLALPGPVPEAGITIWESDHDTIGGTDPGAGNIISGNLDGIYIGNTSLSSDNVIRGNFIGLDITGTKAPGNSRGGIVIYGGVNTIVGGTQPAARNSIAGNAQEGVRLRAGATGNTIQGNYIGTDSSGTLNLGNYDGVYSKGAHDNLIGGLSSGAGNVISGNVNNGVFLDTSTTGTIVQGNLIGVTVKNGLMVPLGNGNCGVDIALSSRNMIGGVDNGAQNTIGGNLYHGIIITGAGADSNSAQGNYIGTDETGDVIGNQIDGILIDGSYDTVGGSAVGATNYISNNGGAGIYVLSGQGDLIRQNSIDSNGNLGIDIDPPGPNQNDSLDADGGPNLSQNYPVIDSVLPYVSTTVIKGHLASVPNNSFTVELFQNEKGDISGYGQGMQFIRAVQVTTDASGNASFATTIPYVVNPRYVITATATDTAGNTSEFSRDPKPITITNPHGGELWITQEPDTIRWTISGNITAVGIDLSTDSGKTFYNFASGIDAKQGEYIWIPPLGTLSKRCMIDVWDKDHHDIVDTSHVFKVKGYELTRDSSGRYVRYTPARHGWQFPNDSADIFPSPWFNQFNYQTGTDPNTGSLYPPVIQLFGKSFYFPDWPVFVQAFGDNQSYYSKSLPVYKPSAVKRWLDKAGRWGGSCFGMANSSFMAFDDPSAFNSNFSEIGSFNVLSDLPIAPATRTVINRLMTRQFGRETQALISDNWNVPPMQTVSDIKEMLKDEVRNDRILLLFNQNGSGAHAVSPYKVESDPVHPGQKWIYIYDNNYPTLDFLKIVVDSASNFWTYINLSTWGGTKGLFLCDPASDYYSIPTLSQKPLSQNNFISAPQAAGSYSNVFNTPGASIRISNASGDSIGYADSIAFTRMTGAVPIIPFTGRFHPPIGYRIPVSGDYSVVMKSFPDSTAYFSFLTDSVIFGFRRSNVHSTETDNLKIGTALEYSNRDAAPKNADLESIIISGDNERVVSLKNAVVRQGDSLHLDVVNRQYLKVVNTGDSLHYSLNLQYASAEGTISFTHANLTVPPHAAAQIVPSWDSMAYQPAKVLIDHTNSGTFDDSISIDNQSIGWYPDSLTLTPNAITGGKSALGSVMLNAIAPHGGMLVHLSSSTPSFASVPATVFMPAGQGSGSFNVTTQVTAVPETVVISALANSITRRDTFIVLPQGIETLALNPAGGVIGGDSATCTVMLSNPAPTGGKLITLMNGNPAIATLPSSILVLQGALSQSFKVHTSPVQHLDSCIITASSGSRQASVTLFVSSFGHLKIVPDTVIGGNGSTLYDSIAVPAPPAGIHFTLKSSDTVTAWTAPSLYIGSGQTQAYASVATIGVAKDTVITFSVTNAPYPISGSLLVRPAGLATFTDLPNRGCQLGEHQILRRKFIAGNPIQFQMALDGQAPQSGASIRVSSDHPSELPVDSLLLLPSGSWGTTWVATSHDVVASPVDVIVSLSYLSTVVRDTVTIVPRVHYTFVPLSDSTASGISLSINNPGDVVGYINGRIFKWHTGQRTFMDTVKGFHLSSVSAINDSGHIAGQAYGHAAIWKKDTTIVLPEPLGLASGDAVDVNNNDDVVGTVNSSGQPWDQKGCTWFNGIPSLLDSYDAQHYSAPAGINSSRQIAGTAFGNDYTITNAAVLWENSHITWSMAGVVVYYNDAYYVNAGAINDSGVIAGEYYVTPGLVSRGWFIRKGTDTINYSTVPPFYGTRPTRINSSGDVVGTMWMDDYETEPVGFLYKQGYYYDLNCLVDNIPPGKYLERATWINDAGAIAAQVRTTHTGQEQACVLIPTGGALGVKKGNPAQIPGSYALLQNYPNPFNPVTTIRYELPKASRVLLKVYDVLGQEVATLVDQEEPAGVYSVQFNGRSLGTGIYFYRLQAGSFTETKKLILMK